jgi:DNA-binding MarR family transcriptional regulator
MHPSTLHRDLKPLEKQNLTADAFDRDDRRVRLISITRSGEAKLAEAIPAWRRAQAQVHDVLGHEVTLSLNALLDLTCAKVAP